MRTRTYASCFAALAAIALGLSVSVRGHFREPMALDYVHQFLVVLSGTDPLVWRRIQVPAAYSFCLGERQCPPEDCGGVHGYAEFLNAIANPKHPRHSEMTEWIGSAWTAERLQAAAREVR